MENKKLRQSCKRLQLGKWKKNYNLKDEDVCDWGDGNPGGSMINRKYGFKYHSISTLPKEEEKKRSPAKYGKR